MKTKRKKRIRKRQSVIEVKWKINWGMLAIGLLAFIPSCIVANLIYNNREVRMHGELKSCPIVEISYSYKGGNSGDVEIDGKRLSVYKLEDKYHVGDSLLVRYDKEKSLVIQEKYKEWNFFVFYALDSVLLILGLLLIYGGLSGKSSY